ncbi:MAG: RpiB/LacA/LacB family sugar-phosphate isomerase [Clostridiales bacterium]|jgi:ribose 5-phosphate isomerase B|nr:RpiB/LacA/LacB family sugar-phosphate isomerase [Clostridiales bacterium]MDR2750148.1 RpiB/LacA/LacB family sugar-phosphate isomerase [Clostridiales bacterium]
MKIAIASDKDGTPLKLYLVEELKRLGHKVDNLEVANSEFSDYPDIACMLGRAVALTPYDVGILTSGTGVGMSSAASKVSGIYSELCTSVTAAEHARVSQKANVLCLSAWLTSREIALAIAVKFIDTPRQINGPTGEENNKVLEEWIKARKRVSL